MKTRAQILENIYCSKAFAAYLSKMQPEELREDLKAELTLMLCELPEDKLIGMYERGEVLHYIARAGLNMVASTRSRFYNQYRNFTPLEGVAEKEDRFLDNGGGASVVVYHNTRILEYMLQTDTNLEPEEEEDHRQAQLPELLGELHEFEAGLVKLWGEGGRNMSEIARSTGIPYRSVSAAINSGIKKIKNRVKKYAD